MLAAMARSLGYGKTIGYEELARQYVPQAFTDNAALQNAMGREALRVLKASENFGTRRRPGSDDEEQPAAPRRRWIWPPVTAIAPVAQPAFTRVRSFGDERVG